LPHRKNTLDDDEKGVADKLSADDKEEIENTCDAASYVIVNPRTLRPLHAIAATSHAIAATLSYTQDQRGPRLVR
jgi:hypothetical protein